MEEERLAKQKQEEEEKIRVLFNYNKVITFLNNQFIIILVRKWENWKTKTKEIDN